MWLKHRTEKEQLLEIDQTRMRHNITVSVDQGAALFLFCDDPRIILSLQNPVLSFSSCAQLDL